MSLYRTCEKCDGDGGYPTSDEKGRRCPQENMLCVVEVAADIQEVYEKVARWLFARREGGWARLGLVTYDGLDDEEKGFLLADARDLLLLVGVAEEAGPR